MNPIVADDTAGDSIMARPDHALPSWAPLSKAQCLMMAIELRRLRPVTRTLSRERPDAEPQGAAGRSQ